MRYKEPRIGATAQKILLLLGTGVSLGFSYSPKQYSYILKTAAKEWEWINRRTLYATIKNLYKSKLVDEKENSDESTTIVLTKKGKKKVLTYKINEMEVPIMKKWDKKWRIVIFDIPERFKKARNALAYALKQMEFFPLQKSVFIHPFECKNEIDFVIEFFSVRPYVRYIVAEHIDNEFHIKTRFNLN